MRVGEPHPVRVPPLERRECRRTFDKRPPCSSHTFFNDKGFHNHCSHHRKLAARATVFDFLLEPAVFQHEIAAVSL